MLDGRRAAAVSALVVALAAVSHCPDRAHPGAYVIAGARSMQPITNDWLAAYGRSHPGYFARVDAGGTSAGVRDLAAGSLHFATADRRLEPSERGHAVTVGRELLAVAVHKDNPVGDLSDNELVGIFTGRITNWREIGGMDAPITVVALSEASSLRGWFAELALHDGALAPAARTVDTTALALEAIAADPAAIGYLPANELDDRVRPLALGGAAPTFADAQAGRYPLLVPLYFVFPSPPVNNMYGDLLDWIDGPDGQAIARRHGLLPPPPRTTIQRRLEAWLLRHHEGALEQSVAMLFVVLGDD